MPAGAQERTEKPTPRRIQKARGEGKVAKSREVNSLASLIGTSIGLWVSLSLILEYFRGLMQGLWGNGFNALAITNSGNLFPLFQHSAKALIVMSAPAVLGGLVFSIAANYLQNKGFLMSWGAVFRFDLSVLNPVNGLQRLFNLRSLVELGKSIIKFIVVSYALYSVFKVNYHLLIPTVFQDPVEIARSMGYLTFHMFLKVILLMLVVSYLDWRYQKWQYIKDLMMTKQEVKEEIKQSEGDPKIKSKIRSKQLEIARARMLAEVPKAEVVVTNPTHYAVALAYKMGEMEAPKVVAKGIDHMAKKIIKIARFHGVTIVHNPPLARALYRQVPLGNTIPVELYKAVAKVLAYVYQQKQRFKYGT